MQWMRDGGKVQRLQEDFVVAVYFNGEIFDVFQKVVPLDLVLGRHGRYGLNGRVLLLFLLEASSAFGWLGIP